MIQMHEIEKNLINLEDFPPSTPLPSPFLNQSGDLEQSSFLPSPGGQFQQDVLPQSPFYTQPLTPSLFEREGINFGSSLLSNPLTPTPDNEQSLQTNSSGTSRNLPTKKRKLSQKNQGQSASKKISPQKQKSTHNSQEVIKQNELSVISPPLNPIPQTSPVTEIKNDNNFDRMDTTVFSEIEAVLNPNNHNDSSPQTETTHLMDILQPFSPILSLAEKIENLPSTPAFDLGIPDLHKTTQSPLITQNLSLITQTLSLENIMQILAHTTVASLPVETKTSNIEKNNNCDDPLTLEKLLGLLLQSEGILTENPLLVPHQLSLTSPTEIAQQTRKPSQKIQTNLNHRFQCDFPECTKNFKHKYTLNRHKKTHGAREKLCCDFPNCGKSFFEIGSRGLNRHMKTHNKRKASKKISPQKQKSTHNNPEVIKQNELCVISPPLNLIPQTSPVTEIKNDNNFDRTDTTLFSEIEAVLNPNNRNDSSPQTETTHLMDIFQPFSPLLSLSEQIENLPRTPAFDLGIPELHETSQSSLITQNPSLTTQTLSLGNTMQISAPPTVQTSPVTEIKITDTNRNPQEVKSAEAPFYQTGTNRENKNHKKCAFTSNGCDPQISLIIEAVKSAISLILSMPASSPELRQSQLSFGTASIQTTLSVMLPKLISSKQQVESQVSVLTKAIRDLLSRIISTPIPEQRESQIALLLNMLQHVLSAMSPTPIIKQETIDLTSASGPDLCTTSPSLTVLGNSTLNKNLHPKTSPAFFFESSQHQRIENCNSHQTHVPKQGTDTSSPPSRNPCALFGSDRPPSSGKQAEASSDMSALNNMAQ
jgi:hypothetical protein